MPLGGHHTTTSVNYFGGFRTDWEAWWYSISHWSNDCVPRPRSGPTSGFAKLAEVGPQTKLEYRTTRRPKSETWSSNSKEHEAWAEFAQNRINSFTGSSVAHQFPTQILTSEVSQRPHSEGVANPAPSGMLADVRTKWTPKRPVGNST